MTTLFAIVRDAAAKRAAYRNTVSELSRLPRDLAIEDLAIYPGDAQSIAQRAVYGA